MKKLLFILLTLITSYSFAQVKVIKVKGTPGAYNFSKSGDSIIFYVAGVRQALSVGTVTDLSNYYNKTAVNDSLAGKVDTAYHQTLAAKPPLKFTVYTKDSAQIYMNLDSTINNSDSSVPTSNAVNKYVNRTTNGYAESFVSGNVSNGNGETQGIATDSLGNIYVIGTTSLRKYDSNYNLITVNATPFTGTSGFVHMNDGDIYKGKLVVPTYNTSPTYKKALLVYNLDLTLYAEYPMSTAIGGISAGSISHDTLYMASYEDPVPYQINKYLMPDYTIGVDTVRLISTITFAKATDINRVQGIKVVDTTIYLGTDFGEIYSCNIGGGNFKYLYKFPKLSYAQSHEGIDVFNGQIRVSVDSAGGSALTYIHYLNPATVNQFTIQNGVLTAYIQSLLNGNLTVSGDVNILAKGELNFRKSLDSKKNFSLWVPDNIPVLGIVDSLQSLTSGLFIAQGGKIGINKYNPTEALDVVGNIKGTGLVTGGTASKNSANLAAELSDETGTGLSVFNSSPTFNSTVTFKNGTATLANVSQGSTGGVIQTFGTSAGQMSGFFSFDGSDAANSAYVAMGIATSGSYFGTTGASIFASSKNGTGTQLPFVFGGFNGSWKDWMVINTNGNVGFGLSSRTSNSTVQVNGSFATAYIAKTATYTATSTDYTINCNGTFTVTLPTAVGITGRIYVIKNSGSGTITMAGTSSQTFDGVTSPTIAAGAVAQYQSTNAAWIKIN